MRPIRLTVSGLNSFKEEQCIDFAAVCDGSVFGIFGPTGSGKSTVIDAITLALYGKVERAPRGLQGIVNKGLDSALVDFTFALGTAEGEKVYRVERKYVAKDDAVTCRLARLTCLSGETPEVLADKVTQVDALAQSILGLTVEDFTRAVVLPQGKFAEFLSLRGADRRDMLERIFGLSDYGEKLVAVVQTELRSADSRLRELDIMAQSLGEADSAAVKTKEKILSQTRQEVTERQAALLKAETAREGARKIVDLQVALGKAERRRAQLETDALRIGQLASALKQLELALGMEQLVEDAEAACQLLDGAVKRQVQSEAAEAEAAQAMTMAELDLKSTEESLKNNEPLLQRKLVGAERAERLEMEASGLVEQLRQQTKALDQVAKNHGELVERSENLATTDQALSRELTQLKRELDSLRVDSRVREALGNAEMANQRLAHSEKQLQEVTVQREAKSLELKLSKEAFRAAETAATTASEHSAKLNKKRHEILSSAGLSEETSLQTALLGFRLAAQEMATASKATAELEKLMADNRAALQAREGTLGQLQEEELSNKASLHQLTSSLGAAESRVAELRRKVMAKSLARSLTPQLPCPVCGATDHPNPALGDDVHLLDAAESDLRDLRGEHSRVFSHATSLRERCATAKTDATRLRDERDSLKLRLQAESETLARAGGKLLKEGVEDGYVEALLDELEASATSLSETRSDAAQCSTNATRLSAELAHIEERHALFCRLAEAERATVDELCEAIGVADIAVYALDVANKDRKLDEISRVIRAKEQGAEKTRTELRLAEQDLATTKARLRELEMHLAALKKQHLDHQIEIDSLTSGLSATDFRRKAELELVELRQAFDQAKQAVRASRDDQTQYKHELAAATEAVGSRGADSERLTRRLTLALESHGFADIAAWRETLKHRQRREAWQRDVEKHSAELLECGNEIMKLSRDLDGQNISVEEWQTLLDQVEEQAAAFETAVGGRGRAEAALADVMRRHHELVSIRTEEKPLRWRKGLLDEVAALLRGNALVEFMATEHLYAIAGVATGWLRHLSRNRYALEVAPDGGFLIRDDAEGGMLRPVFTLSGGETFVTSLALALALSSQIQLRGRYPLEFFFLDEGFGTLDPELLDVVMSSLERMQGQNVSIGIISHVPELRERIQRKIIVIPAESGGRGSRLVVS